MLETQKNRAVIYCRVSTKEQVEEGNSLASQERICNEYALKNGYEVAAVFIEQGESAKTADRTELKKLIAFCAIKKNDVKVVIAYKIDRISRNTDDYSQLRVLFKRYGVEIKSTSEYFEDTPAGRFMENIIANVAQFDNDVRAERSTGGMKDATREGRYVWKAPFGYSNVRVDGRATIAPNEFAPIVRKIFEEITLKKYPLEEIRKKMSAECLVIQDKIYLSKSLFYRLIKNELYIGWINMLGERNKGTFEPIIPEELFSEVQSTLKNQGEKKQFRKVTNTDFPLRRFLKHSSGKSMTGAWSTGRKQKYAYYLIHQTGINIPKGELEDAFKEWLNNFKMDLKNFDKLYAYLKTLLQNEEHNFKLKAGRLEKRMSELKNYQSSIIDKNIEGVIANELCKEKLLQVNIELGEIEKKIYRLPTFEMSNDEVLSLIREVLLRPGDLWEKASFEEKVYLQWFYFPAGIEIDKSGSRTTKICKIFNLKSLFLSPYSPKVNHRFKKSNTNILQLSLPPPNTLEIQGPEIWDDLKDEALKLKRILNGEGDLLI